ncbi:hypothetical protein AGMMS49928_14190 [Spirochaetia bacterium]|nr:hypothetical protein AGMMS49928_14190 [Spirochaetia bacterium]
MRKAQKTKRKAPRFFCDSCGAEVPFEEKRCPKCGKFFASIRCPKCGFTGDDELFKDGCPACGYSAAGGKGRTARKQEWQKSGALPLWVYFLTAAIIAALCAVLLTV